MSQNISWLGNDYQNVPYVQLPKTGGGTARFDDASVVTAVASDVAQGKIFLTSNGTITTGTASGGGDTTCVVTLSYNDISEMWEPDKTYAEIAAAYNNNVEVVCVCDDEALAGATCTWADNLFIYFLQFFRFDENDIAYIENCGYQLSANGIDAFETMLYYDIRDGNASSSEVASGAQFFNESGFAIGTAVRRSSADLTVSGATVTAPAGYYASAASKSVAGTDRLVLLQTTALGTLSISSTSAADTGKTVTLASTTNWDDYDILLVDISVGTTTNGRHTSTVSGVLLTGTSNVTTKNTYTVMSNKWNSKLSSSGTASTRQSTTAYGVYVNSASASSGTLTLTVYYRYNSNSTGTLNGTYTARVYGIKLIDLIGG